jgi:type IV pilus assembly protein PilA
MTNAFPNQPQAPQKSNKAVIIIVVIAVLFFACAICGILSAIAVPNFIKFQNRSKQAEAKISLKAIYTSQKSEFAASDAYTTDTLSLFVDATRYSCFLSATDSIKAKLSPVSFSDLRLPPDWIPGIRGTCPTCEFVAICAGSLSSTSLDIWGISSKDSDCNGFPVKAGSPCNLTANVE